jgi:hypothetical protein
MAINLSHRNGLLVPCPRCPCQWSKMLIVLISLWALEVSLSALAAGSQGPLISHSRPSPPDSSP